MAENDKFSGLLVHARNLGQLRGEAADNLNRAIELAEQQLAGLRLGSGGEVELSADDTGAEFLGFQKWGDRWRLTVESRYGVNEHEWTTEPLTNETIERRRWAVKLLPKLLQAMIKAAEEDLTSIAEAADDAIDFAASLQSASAAPPQPQPPPKNGIQAIAALADSAPSARAANAARGGLSSGSGLGRVAGGNGPGRVGKGK